MLHQIVWAGMRETLGETHLETLTSQEDLSMSYLRFEYEDAEASPGEALTESLSFLLNRFSESISHVPSI